MATTITAKPGVARARIERLRVAAAAWWKRAARAARNGPVATQAAGGGLVVAGVWLTWGMPVAFMLAGLAMVAVGTLYEAGRS